ncbi:hypothetical protein AR457_15410 [Streptomyces agglomeratus]|uniref:AAA+ ATPase domain-containing protein n=1 Tax=Streptomyces agglomeratus TaxID=285458 RepID=A0A1E5P7Z5_9ACTN|nr:hypothetical protein [Streptomyces agglomeratus]OEJ25648.1 hypothetical protein AS594_15225 [Streptomyces agglomeratus]OEJ40313.1 hypothetical protein BGK70_21245 [Streptomyces agglomeratus]OEJ45309.1 hypothetical protein AR457_15410 [Streptomyces agglomeratus]OEJ52862.1 hypothetical protein BGK72_20885 [Streptomyces agglomeratus]OEJ60198.1 hypothetical protein BGM19_21585 [Streptomyces agglomeratus]
MDRELFGREAVLDGLAPRLIGLPPRGFQKVPFEHRDDLPAVVLAGGRGMGKTAVLKRLHTGYKQRTPVALIDCERPQFAERPAQHAPSWSPVTEALAELGEQLAPPVHGAGAVEFPRLAAGLLAVASLGWQPHDDENILAEGLRLGLLVEPGSRWRNQTRTWLTKVVAKFAAMASGVGPGLDVVVETTVESLLDDLFNRSQRSSADWYGNYPGAGGKAKRGLTLLALHFRRGSEHRVRAERHLVGALRADLDAAYQGMGRLRRVGRPVLLIDNAQAPLGRRLVEPVLRDRADGKHDHVVLIAALRGHDHPALRHAVRRALPEVRHELGWRRGGEIASGAVIVGLTPLEPEHVRQFFDLTDPRQRTRPRLARAVHRLTGGRPVGVDLLARAAGQDEHPERFTPASLLAAPVTLREDREGQEVAAELLARLVPPSRLDWLTVLAPAHDVPSAEALAASRLPGEEGRTGLAAVRDVRTLLADEHWPSDPAHLVGDPFLRTLLLHRLRHGDHDAGRWRAVHETLRGYYADRSAPRRLHHELALGVTEGAVTYLRETFALADARVWLDELRFIASAPHFDDPDVRRQVALGGGDPSAAPPGVDTALHLRIRRLLFAVWQLTDPLALPDDEVTEKMGYELGLLSELHSSGNEVLWQASRSWPQAVREWRDPGHRSGGGS